MTIASTATVAVGEGDWGDPKEDEHPQVPLYRTTTERRAFSLQITTDVSKNGCWQRTRIWANWIYRTAKGRVGEGCTRGRRGWLGLDYYALQKVEVRRKSISKCWECTSSGEGRNYLTVRGPCRQLAGPLKSSVVSHTPPSSDSYLATISAPRWKRER